MTRDEVERYRRRLQAMNRRLTGEVSELGGEALRASGGKGEGSLTDSPGDAGDLSVDQFQ
jgi:hypothetical protein